MRFEGFLSNRSVNLTGLIQIIDDLEASAEDIADRLGGDLDT